MNNNPIQAESGNPVAMLRRFAQPRAAAERCELCSTILAPDHRHLLAMESRQVVCACDACALRFHAVAGGRFKLIPRDARSLPNFHVTDSEWENLALPINLAFFYYNTLVGKIVAMYPSPAGATESLLPLTAWETFVVANPPLADLAPDVEALLVNRVAGAQQYFIAPIDACYELVGLIRMRWRGLSGGHEVWREIDAFFARLAEKSKPCTASLEEPSHA